MPTAAEKRLTAGRLLLGARVRELRTEAGLQLAEFAELAGISRSQLSDFERGRKLPTLRTLDGIANALGTTAARLLLGIYPWGNTEAPRRTPKPPPDGRAGRTIRRLTAPRDGRPDPIITGRWSSPLHTDSHVSAAVCQCPSRSKKIRQASSSDSGWGTDTAPLARWAMPKPATPGL